MLSSPDKESAPSSTSGPGLTDPPLHAPALPAPSPLRRTFFGDDGLRAGWSLLLFFLLLFLFGTAANRTVSALHPSHPAAHQQLAPGKAMLQELFPFALVGLCTFIMSRVERRPMRAFGIGSTPGAARQLFAGLAWGAALLVLLVSALAVTHLLVVTGVQLSPAAALRFGAEWLLAFFFVALFEEYALRGYLQFTLARGLAGAFHAITSSPNARTVGFWVAAALLSFVFGFGHSTNPGESPLGLVSAGLIGLVFCLSLWRTGSLWWALGFHAAWDWAQSFLFGVADSGHLVAFRLLNSRPQGNPLLSGGLTGPEGSLYVLPTIVLTAAAIHLSLRNTGWPVPGSEASGLAPGNSRRRGAATPSHPLL